MDTSTNVPLLCQLSASETITLALQVKANNSSRTSQAGSALEAIQLLARLHLLLDLVSSDISLYRGI
jgi:hypothetical protein